MFKLSVITDEVSQDLSQVLAFARDFHLDGVEVRSLWNKQISSMSDREIGELSRALSGEGLAVPCVSSPFFKCPMDSPEDVRKHLDILRRMIDVAEKFSCSLIRGFTFWRKGRFADAQPKLLKHFHPVLEILSSAPDCVLGIENEAACTVGTGGELAGFLSSLGSPQVKAIWDPGNVVFVPGVHEVPYPDGYDLAKPYMIHFHLKDAKKDESGKPHWTLLGEGIIDYRGQFKALADDGYEGYVSLETHWRPKELSKELIDRPGGPAYSEGGNVGSRLCMESLLKMLEDLGLR